MSGGEISLCFFWSDKVSYCFKFYFYIIKLYSLHEIIIHYIFRLKIYLISQDQRNKQWAVM